MKTISFLSLTTLLLVSCHNAWNQDDNATFYRACIDDTKTWQHPPGDPSAYCNCVIAKVKEKYPDENDAMKHIDSLAYDKDLLACRDSLSRP